jgi:nucleoside-diphosphate-sugar epimerase
MSISGKRIALIGGAGFIGHHLALELSRRGAKVNVVDSLQVNNLLMLATADLDSYSRKLYTGMVNQRLDLMREAGVELHAQDARDYHALSRILGQVKPEVIVQLAAVAHANRSNKDPFSTFDHSLRTLENALDIARDNCNHFVYFSSSMVYGNFQGDAVDEEHPLNPIGIYGALKVAGEKIVIAYNQVFGLPFTIVRPSALYGPRCISRRVGQIFIENALRGQKLRIDGDGDDRLDFTHIDDVVQGLCLVIESKESRNQIFNLTYGASRSITDLLTVIKQYFPKVSVESVPRDRLMPERGTLNVTKARELLGYEPQNPVEIAFPRYVEWYLSNQRPAGESKGPY